MDQGKIIDNQKPRKPGIWLDISLRHASNYLEVLCELRKKHSDAEIQQSNELLTIHRSLWTSLIAEIRKLFDNSRNPNYSLRNIDFFKKNLYKSIVDSVYGDRIVSRIIKTGNTFTLHLGKENKEILSVAEICDSDLSELLKRLKKPIQDFVKHEREQN